MTDRQALRALIDAQAEDDGLWFVAQTAPEDYLQRALRALHAAGEALLASEETPLTAEEEAEDRQEAAELQRAYASGALEAEMIPHLPAEETPPASEPPASDRLDDALNAIVMGEPLRLDPAVESLIQTDAAIARLRAQVRREVEGLRGDADIWGGAARNSAIKAVLALPSLQEPSCTE